MVVDFITKLFYQNSLKSWGISFGIIIGSFIFGKIFFWLFQNYILKITSKTKNKLDDVLVLSLEKPILVAIVLAGMNLATKRLVFPEIIYSGLNKLYLAAFILTLTWFITSAINNFFKHYVKPLVEKTENDLDDQILPVVRKGLILATWMLGVIVALNNVGINVGAFLAGMGIGGIAFAMAAKDTVSNFFGGITIFVDRPFKIKDRIKVNGFDGFVQEVGIRSTRIKTLEGRIVTIPNAKFTDGIVENVSMEDARKVKFNLGLTYDTTEVQMEQARTYVEEILKAHPNVRSDYMIEFLNFGAFSLDILVIYYVTGSDIFSSQTEVNLAILEKFNKENLSFAFPTQTIEMLTVEKQ